MPNTFPPGIGISGKEDYNPAIHLFGRRFFSDQSTIELLVEFLLVVSSRKFIDREFDTPLPTYEAIKHWPNRRELTYAPKARLNLKLFSFLSASKLDTRHQVHRDHLKELYGLMGSRIEAREEDKDAVLRTLENLFLGFQGAGSQRTWCAQSFVPICSGLVAGESIWQQSKARDVEDWQEALNYFTHNQWLFLARGGEVLYLQVCNALSQTHEVIDGWAQQTGLKSGLTTDELDPAWLHRQLNSGLMRLFEECPATVSGLAEFVDSGVEKETSQRTDTNYGQLKYTTCGWCPSQSWEEGYLFAVEMQRILRARIELMERLDLLELECSLQLLRSLAMQAARYTSLSDAALFPPYRLAISDPAGDNESVRHISKRSVQAVQKMIYDALRHEEIESRVPKSDRAKLYREADRRYGHKLFITVAKRVGLITPRRGAGMRFVINERLLRLLVVALIPSGRLTYDSFKRLVEHHYGLAIDEPSLSRASNWASRIIIESFEDPTDDWFQDMLEAAGVLRRLSDSCSIVENMIGDDIGEG